MIQIRNSDGKEFPNATSTGLNKYVTVPSVEQETEGQVYVEANLNDGTPTIKKTYSVTIVPNN